MKNRKHWQTLATCLIALALGGCGGEGGSPATETVSTPGTLPAPTPSPTPAPSDYRTIFDLSTSQYLRSEVASVTIQRRYAMGATPLYTFEAATTRLGTDPQALIYEYSGQTHALNLQFDGQTINIPSSAMTTQTNDQMLSSKITLTPDFWVAFRLVRMNTAFHYFAFSELQQDWNGFPDAGARVSRESYHRFLLGAETQRADMPQSGIRRYTAQLASSFASYDGAGGLIGSTTINVDFMERTVSGTFATTQASFMEGQQPVVATLTFDGTIDRANNVIQGRVTSPEGFAGSFRGRLFGPAAEVGLIFTIERPDRAMVGTVGGVFVP
ncbi:hypothetical protein [Sphingobium ummariense]